MRVAILTDGESVSAHFGRCPFFTIVDIDNGKVIKREVVNNPGHQPGVIPQFLYQRGVNCIVAGGMGTRATQFFNDFGIEPIVGINASINEVIDLLLQGQLKSGESLCKPGMGKGYGFDKTECNHPHQDNCEH